jgi:lysozyme
MIEQALPIALALMRRFEGFYSKPYMCPAGVPTIGFGATYYEDGSWVTLSDAPITRERAETLLLWMVAHKYLPPVIKLCPGTDSPERLAALIDFTYNLGASALKNSTLRRKVNAGEWGDVPNQLRKWDKAGGRVLRGLTIRREAEASLI